jgi:signal transduction histidine kinase
MVESRHSAILVVDDDQQLLEMIATLLKRSGYEVTTAEEGEDALHKAAEHPPDLIILDVNMPHMDGLEVCRRLKANSDTRLIPVIFLTADDFVEHKIAGLELGANDYITKPFDSKEFLARVKSHVEGSLSRQEYGEQEKLKALETMLDQIAHELRNPLVAIGGFARRIHNRITDDDLLKSYADHIYHEVERLEGTLNEIIELKNIILGSLTSFDPAGFLTEVLQPFKKTLKQKHIQLGTSLPPETAAILGDKKHLTMAVANIITNAIEAMDETGGKLDVTLEQNAQYCRIAIQDTGRGIENSAIPLVFRPFYTSKISGSGMGLCAVQHIVDMHNGTVLLTSKPNDGTRVEINLPNDCRKHNENEPAPQ